MKKKQSFCFTIRVWHCFFGVTLTFRKTFATRVTDISYYYYLSIHAWHFVAINSLHFFRSQKTHPGQVKFLSECPTDENKVSKVFNVVTVSTLLVVLPLEIVIMNMS